MNVENSGELSELRAKIQKEVATQSAKLLVGGIVVLAGIAVTGWWFYLKPTLIDLAGGVPKGAVVAFERVDCPNGWREYEKLYGRFIRGIDKSNEQRDPSGERGIGGYQPDEFKKHHHPFVREVWGFGSSGSNPEASNGRGGAGIKASLAVGGGETRPKNIALLYCSKD